MRLPIILMLLTVLLLPADLQGLAHDLQAGAETARATVASFLDRNDEVQVADAAPRLTLGGPVAKVH